MDENQLWYLMKHDDDSVFGPIPFEQLARWAAEAQVSPLDKVSTDQVHWMKAPMLADLEMDYLIEVDDEQYYGPTTLGAVKEFLAAGEINLDSRITNCTDNSVTSVREVPALNPREEERPVRTSIRRSLQQRIRELEGALLEERRAHEQTEHLVDRLKAQIASLKRQQPQTY